MAKVSLATIKNWFISNLKPTQSQFWDTWDSFRHKDDAVPAAEVSGLDTLLAGKAEATHTADPNAHLDIVATLRDEMTRAGLSAQLLDITLPPEEVVDPAANSIIEKLNTWLSAPLILQEDTLIYVRYWHSELSDGDAATIRTWALFMLEAGNYGPGGQPIPQVRVVNDLSFGPDLELGTRRVKLSTIPVMTQAGGSSIGTQDQFNKRVDELVIAGITIEDVNGSPIGNVTDTIRLDGIDFDNLSKTIKMPKSSYVLLYDNDFPVKVTNTTVGQLIKSYTIPPGSIPPSAFLRVMARFGKVQGNTAGYVFDLVCDSPVSQQFKIVNLYNTGSVQANINANVTHTVERHFNFKNGVVRGMVTSGTFVSDVTVRSKDQVTTDLTQELTINVRMHQLVANTDDVLEVEWIMIEVIPN